MKPFPRICALSLGRLLCLLEWIHFLVQTAFLSCLRYAHSSFFAILSSLTLLSLFFFALSLSHTKRVQLEPQEASPLLPVTSSRLCSGSWATTPSILNSIPSYAGQSRCMGSTTIKPIPTRACVRALRSCLRSSHLLKSPPRQSVQQGQHALS